MGRHVEDSLAIVEPIPSSYISHCGNSFDNLNFVDVGSGAGLLRLILAIACSGWKVTLLEFMSERCVFLEHVVGSIGLQNVQVMREQAEEEGFDIAVARAVAELRVLAEYCLPLVRVGGLFLTAKGHDPQVYMSVGINIYECSSSMWFSSIMPVQTSCQEEVTRAKR